jgi:AraC-like DNA-binding protein
MSTLMRTADQAPADRLEFWRHLVSRTFVPLDVPTVARDGFSGEIHSRTVGGLYLADVRADAQVVRRTPRLIGQAQHDYYKLGLQLRGECLLTQDGRAAPIGLGDLAIYDSTRPYELVFDDAFRMLVMMFPRRLLRLPPATMAEITATRISGRQGVGGVVAPFLAELARNVDEVSPATSERLADNVLDLLHTLFSERLETLPDTVEPLQRGLLLRIMAFIEARLGDPDLDGAAVALALALAHHISTRYLHKLFVSQGVSVGRHIRQRRLDHCRRALADPGMAGESVGSIAARWDLLDAAHFSRMFKATYGESPREYRMRVVVSGRSPFAHSA